MEHIVNGKKVEMTSEQQEQLNKFREEASAEKLQRECSNKRALAYPPIQDYLDAKVKQASTDPELVAEGMQQESEYIVACMAVKAQYPKP